MAWGSAGGWGAPTGWNGGMSMPSIGWTPGGGMGGATNALNYLAPAMRAATQLGGQKPSMSASSIVPRALGMIGRRPMQAGGHPSPAPPAVPSHSTPFDIASDPQLLHDIARLKAYTTTRGITPEPGLGRLDQRLEDVAPFLLSEVAPALLEAPFLAAAGHRAWKNIEDRTKELEDLPVIREPPTPRYIHPGSTKSHSKMPGTHRRGGVAKKALLLAKRKRRVADRKR